MNYITKVQHKYKLGDKVRCIRKRHYHEGQTGTITEKMPFTFSYPGYRVRFGDEVVAMSEISLKKVGWIARRLSLMDVERKRRPC